MTTSLYTMRTVSGLASDSSLAKPLVNDIVSDLATKGMAASATGSQGQTL